MHLGQHLSTVFQLFHRVKITRQFNRSFFLLRAFHLLTRSGLNALQACSSALSWGFLNPFCWLHCFLSFMSSSLLVYSLVGNVHTSVAFSEGMQQGLKFQSSHSCPLDSLAGYKILCCKLISFRNLNIFFHNLLKQGLANFKGPNNKYFRLRGTYIIFVMM